MDNTSKTLYIPLYAKARISHMGIILDDKRAEEIWANVDFALKGKSRSKWLAYYMAMRARVFDDWARLMVNANPNAVVLHIGAGLDSRVLRVEHENIWYDIDMADVIAERKLHYSETDTYHMLAGDARDAEWLEVIDSDSAIIILEGISMYMTNDELSQLYTRLETKFDRLSILMDVYTPFGAKMSKVKNPVKDVGVSQVYGVAGPIIPINNTSITYVAEHSMTPQYLIDEIKGIDKGIFSTLFAGGLAKKCYRLYEYKK